MQVICGALVRCCVLLCCAVRPTILYLFWLLACLFVSFSLHFRHRCRWLSLLLLFFPCNVHLLAGFPCVCELLYLSAFIFFLLHFLVLRCFNALFVFSPFFTILYTFPFVSDSQIFCISVFCVCFVSDCFESIEPVYVYLSLSIDV